MLLILLVSETYLLMIMLLILLVSETYIWHVINFVSFRNLLKYVSERDSGVAATTRDYPANSHASKPQPSNYLRNPAVMNATKLHPRLQPTLPS